MTPSFDLPTPNYAGSSNLNSVPGPERELKGSGVFGSEGDNSPFWGARPKRITYSDSPYSKLDQHPGTETYSLPIMKHLNLVTLRSGTGTRNGVQIRLSAKFGVGG